MDMESVDKIRTQYVQKRGRSGEEGARLKDKERAIRSSHWTRLLVLCVGVCGCVWVCVCMCVCVCARAGVVIIIIIIIASMAVALGDDDDDDDDDDDACLCSLVDI